VEKKIVIMFIVLLNLVIFIFEFLFFFFEHHKVEPIKPNDAAILAFKLAAEEKSNFQCRTKNEFVDKNILDNLIQTAKLTNNYIPLIRKIGLVFSDSESMNLSFLKSVVDIRTSSLGLDIDQVQESFLQLESIKENSVQNAWINATERLVVSIRRFAEKTTNPQGIRQYFILLESPFIKETNYFKTILGPLCIAIVQLPISSQGLLIKFWKEISGEQLLKLVHLLQEFITTRILEPTFLNAINKDEFIIAATRVLGLFYNVSQERNMVVAYVEFYNELINERIEKKEDFMNWKNHSGFSFCNYPFILTPSTKSKFLSIESLSQMRRQRINALESLISGFPPQIPVLILQVRRDNLIEDSLSELSNYDPADLKKELKVHFVGEEGIDEGGVRKEWFQLIIKEIFDPKYGMFIQNSETQNYWFNADSTDYTEFQLIGMLLGLAIYNSVILDVHFPQLIYKKLVGLPLTLQDLKDVNPSLLVGFEKLLAFEGNVEEVFGHTFQITYEVFGEKKVQNLKEGGEGIILTNENRKEYVDLYVKWLLEESISKQFNSFLKGFKILCDTPSFKLFRFEELELLICGNPVLDFEALEKSTIYDNGFSKDHPVIKNFWSVVHSLPLNLKKKLLFFATGSDRAPIGGLGNLPFVITRHGPDSDRLPSAHTCFNHLLLPEYATREKLQERLLTAISNSEGFGML